MNFISIQFILYLHNKFNKYKYSSLNEKKLIEIEKLTYQNCIIIYDTDHLNNNKFKQKQYFNRNDKIRK